MCSIFGIQGKDVDPTMLKEFFDRTISRGPDMSRFIEIPCGYLGFHRLAIMGLDERGMQPFHRTTTMWSAMANCMVFVLSAHV